MAFMVGAYVVVSNINPVRCGISQMASTHCNSYNPFSQVCHYTRYHSTQTRHPPVLKFCMWVCMCNDLLNPKDGGSCFISRYTFLYNPLKYYAYFYVQVYGTQSTGKPQRGIPYFVH